MDTPIASAPYGRSGLGYPSVNPTRTTLRGHPFGPTSVRACVPYASGEPARSRFNLYGVWLFHTCRCAAYQTTKRRYLKQQARRCTLDLRSYTSATLSPSDTIRG